MILSGQTIRELDIITPFSERTKFSGMSFGIGYAGYDIRINDILDPITDEIVDEYLILKGEYALCSTIEHFNMPKDVIGIIHDKSSWARSGVFVQNTVIEPGWRGYLSLAVSSSTHKIHKLRSLDPIAQVIFHRIDMETEGYKGKYQDQTNKPTTTILEQ